MTVLVFIFQFGGDSAHLASLNPYIMEAHNKFKRYFRAVCEVPEPEVMYNVDQYSDVTRIHKVMLPTLLSLSIAVSTLNKK